MRNHSTPSPPRPALSALIVVPLRLRPSKILALWSHEMIWCHCHCLAKWPPASLQKELAVNRVTALDLVAFYPPSLYQPPSSPLHFLLTLRRAYVSYTADPFFAPSTPQPPWLRVFLALEGLVQLPLIIYLVRHLSRPRPTSGPVELAGLVLGCVNFMGAAACCSELWCMGEDLVTAEKKAQLLYGTYLPFAIVRK